MFKEKYKNKRIIVFVKNNMKFEGEFLEENELGFWIRDKNVGEKFIAFSNINEIHKVDIK